MSMALPCEAERRDDSRFDLSSDSFNPPPGTWAPDCGHPACVKDAEHCPHEDGWHDWDCPVAVCRFEALRDACSLERGHDGEHQYQLPVHGPAPLLQGDAVPLPGFESVAVVDDGKARPWQA